MINGIAGVVKFQTSMIPAKVHDAKGELVNSPFLVPALDAAGITAAKDFKGFMIDGEFNPMLMMGNQKVTDSGLAFLVGELEKLDPTLYKPLTTYYWHRDMPVRTGGGAIDFVSFMKMNWGSSQQNNGYIDGNTNALDTVSVDIEKTPGKVRIWAKILKIGYTEMLRANQVGRSLNDMLMDGIHVLYNKELDRVTMEGWAELGIPGLYNNTGVQASLVADGADSTKAWDTKTPKEILLDVNEILTSVWAAGEYDVEALPNQLNLPPEVYGYISTTFITDAGDKSILTYIKENNICANQGVDLKIYPNRYGIAAGQGDVDRMVAYKNHESKLRFHLPIPLTRAFTSHDATQFSYLTPYYTFLSQVEFVYLVTIAYRDGI